MRDLKDTVFYRQLNNYWVTARAVFARENESQIVSIMNATTPELAEEFDFDNWNGGTYTFSLRVYAPLVLIEDASLDLNSVESKIRDKLNQVAKDALNESIGTVTILSNSDGKLRNPQIGDVLIGAFGEYKVICKVGDGGNGAIYKVESDGLSFATKVLDVKHRNRKDKLRRFIREISGLHRIRHANVVQVIDAGRTESEIPFYVMPLGEGSLREIIKGRWPMNRRLELANEILQGVGELHKHGIVHRDIKPENILIIDGHAVVADIGIAHFCDANTVLTQKGDRLANFMYCAPEQRDKNPIPAKTMDIYSLGLVIHELLTSQYPLGVERTRVASLDRNLENWDEAIDCATQEIPAKRPQTVADFLNIIAKIRPFYQEPNNPRNFCVHFSIDRFKMAFPDACECPVHTDWKQLSSRMKRLLRAPLDQDVVWWTNGYHNNEVYEVSFDDTTHIMYMSGMECKIKKVMPFNFPYCDWLDCVYVETEPMPATEEGSTTSCRVCRYDNRKLTGSEVDAGCFYDENGGFHEIDRSRLLDVIRNTVPYNFIITSKWSPFNDHGIEPALKEIMKGMLDDTKDSDDFRAFALRLPKPDFDRLDAWWAETSCKLGR